MSKSGTDAYQRIIVAEALAIAILFHLALLFLFAYAPPAPKISAAKTQTIAMLNLEEHGQSSLKELMTWLEYHDPSLIARPDRKFGYAAWRRPPDFRPPLPDLPLEKRLEPPVVFENFKKLPPEHPPQHDSCSRFINYTPSPLPKIRKNIEFQIVAREKYPMAVYGGGAELKPFFQAPLPEALKAAALTARPSRISLAFQGTGLMPRAAVEESCGNTELDNAAIKEILFAADKFAAELVNPGDFVTITVLWNKPEGRK